mmetsp:Transcript_113020/g.196225  ORF Transcript_113020/g.196225 Transcript_113020/m.196225 type:complete len:140 (-) Transcript_113020:82-501(-)
MGGNRRKPRRDLYREEAGQRTLTADSFRSTFGGLAVAHDTTLRSLPDAADFQGEERWDSSTYRDSAPAGDIYTQWHRVFARGTLTDGQLAAWEYHWKEEGGYGYKSTFVKAWKGEVPSTFTTSSVKRDYFFTNQDCVLQ